MAATNKTVNILEELHDWLLDGSESFTQFDGFRRRLKMDQTQFSDLLGISPSTYAKYKKTRECPTLSFREKMSEVVWQAHLISRASQNTRFKLEFEGLERIKYVTWAQFKQFQNLGFKMEEISPQNYSLDWRH